MDTVIAAVFGNLITYRRQQCYRFVVATVSTANTNLFHTTMRGLQTPRHLRFGRGNISSLHSTQLDAHHATSLQDRLPIIHYVRLCIQDAYRYQNA
jgi:hypothetical protein